LNAKLDEGAYERDVVRPLRGAHDSLPRDLVTRYAVDLSMPADGLRERVAEVTALWNKKARGRSPSAAIYSAFQQAHDELLSQAEVRLDDPSWWQKYSSQWKETIGKEIAALADEVRQLYGPAGFVLPGYIAALERLHPNLRGAGVRRALEKAGIPTITPQVLPQQSGLERSSYERLCRSLEEAGARTIFHLVLPSAAIRLFRNPEVSGPGPSRLDRNAVEQRAKTVEAEANSARSRAATAALGLLRTAADTGTDLRQLALFHIVGKVRETRVAGQPAMLTIRSLIELGIAEPDARLVTASLMALEGNNATPAGPEDVRRLVAAGQLAEARRVAASLPVGEREAEAARETVARAAAEVESLLKAAQAALDAGDLAEASRRASAARTMASDDPAVVSFAGSLPPPPPQALVAASDGLDVKLSWPPVPGDEAAVRYRVVRRAGRDPLDQDDGTIVADGPAATTRDTVPPPGEQLRYAVYASADRKRWSPPATCTVEILPPVTDVAMDVERDVVRCTWRAHPAARVQVRRAQGVPPQGPRDGVPVETSGSGFADTGLVAGSARCYAIIAVYRDQRGQERLAEPVLVTAIPERELKPVASLSATLLPGDDQSEPRVRMSWPQPEGADVRIVRSRTACPWSYGDRVRVSDVFSHGEEVSGQLAVRDGRGELTAELPWGHFFLTPVVLNGDVALVGQHTDLGITAPIGAISYERRGQELLLSWDWPPRANAADLRWGKGATATWHVTRGQRARDDGWVHIPARDGPMIVEVRAIEISPAGKAFSAPRVVRIAAAEVKLSYEIVWKRVLPGMTPRDCEIRLSTPEGRHRVTVVAVAKSGVARPAHAGDGREVAHKPVEVSAGRPTAFAVNVPDTFRKPYWLCCFIADGQGVLTDPPIKHMKVG
jgi:hypothetical protein